MAIPTTLCRMNGEYCEINQFVLAKYIQSNGNQYIQLTNGFYKTDQVYAKGYLNNLNADKFLITASTWNLNNNRFSMLGGAQSSLGIGYGALKTQSTIYQQELKVADILYEEQYKNYIFKNLKAGEETYRIIDVSTVIFGVETTNIRLFFGYNSNTAGKLVSFKHVKNGVCIRDMKAAVWIPGKRYVDGNTGTLTLALTNKPGMYDQVSKSFFVNQGTEQFTYQLE